MSTVVSRVDDSDELMRKAANISDSLSGRLTPKQADRFVDHLVDHLRQNSLDDLIVEAEFRVGRWKERIRIMVLLHVRRTGREPNMVWLPSRFCELLSPPATMAVFVKRGDSWTRWSVGCVENIESIYGVEPEDLVVGKAERDGRGQPRIDSFFVERQVGYQVS